MDREQAYREAVSVERIALAPREPFLLERQPNGEVLRVKVTSPAQYLDPSRGCYVEYPAAPKLPDRQD